MIEVHSPPDCAAVSGGHGDLDHSRQARSEEGAMWCIVTDERRRMATKSARPEGVARRSPPSFVAYLRVAPLRVCAALLVDGLLRAITTIADWEDTSLASHIDRASAPA